MLNHGDTFELDSVTVDTPWLMAWYGLKPAVPEQGFQQDEVLFTSQGGVWVLVHRKLKPGHGEPLGMVRAGRQLWIATNDELDLFDADGRLIDKIERDLLPGTPIRRIGGSDGKLLVDVGNKVFSTTDGIDWKPVAGNANVAWSRLQPLSAMQQQEIASLFAPSLPLQRIIADLHSGRIFGSRGVLLVDALAVALLLLAGSGLWTYYKSNRSREKAMNPGTVSPESSPE